MDTYVWIILIVLAFFSGWKLGWYDKNRYKKAVEEVKKLEVKEVDRSEDT